MAQTALESQPVIEQEATPPRDAHLAHHFDTLTQQFEAAKLGMWMFLATEVLLFGGLFCLYAVYRSNHPEIFRYGHQFLDTGWGAINTVVLILSSLTMALAVWCAQCNHQRLLAFFLLLTLLFAADFLVVKYIEYSHKIHENLVWGLKFYEEPKGYAPPVTEPMEPAAIVAASPVVGRTLWMGTCRSCHGTGGEGIPGQGKDIRGSEFIAGKTDAELLAFVKLGRMPFDPLNTTGIQMPPKGGNPIFGDDDLRHIIAYVRTFKAPGGDEGAPADEAPVASEEEFWIPTSVIPAAALGPPGLNVQALATREGAAPAPDGHPSFQPHPSHDPARPANAHMFFGMYFMMTGLHGLHVFAGMILITWLLIRSLKGHFNSDYFTPVDLGGLYWHVVDIIWIFLFPLLYLIS
ncbi:MAG: cytochrome c oxidase subunit 3 [Planctomycetota bacterium]|jgi:cytochrome c oxidase subunit 3